MYCWKNFGRPELEALPEDVPILALGTFAKDALIPDWGHFGVTKTRGCKHGRVTSALHPAFIRRTARAGSSEKQDLSPTLAYDIQAALEKIPRPRLQIIAAPVVAPFQSCDLETDGKLNPRKGPIDQIGFGSVTGETFREHYKEENRALYKETLEKYPIVFHNAPFDMDWLEYNNYRIPEWDDTMLACHLIHGDLPLGLDFVNSMYVHHAPWKHQKRSSLLGDQYHATDLYVTALGWQKLKLELQSQGMWGLYQNEVKPVTRRCIDMKKAGLKIDAERMYKMQLAFTLQLTRIETALNKLAPGTNWNSSKQVMSVLYDVWQLPRQYKEGTDSETGDSEALEELAELTNHPGVKLLRAHRLYAKMIGTYTDHEIDDNGYFHPDISFTTATGRARGFILTIPRGVMRSVFIADHPDWEIAYLDWDRVELWISAVRSGDQAFKDILTKYNFHEYVGERCFGKPVIKGMPEYEDTKHITHGANYGRSAQSISDGHDIPLPTVQKVLNWMEVTFPVWAKWRKDMHEEARRTGGLTNAFGYRRYMWSGNIKGMAYSLDPQSDVAHMCKRVIIQLWDELPSPARIMFPFHDALAITYPKEMRDVVIPIAQARMEQAWPQLGGWAAKCGIGYGDNLAEASK